MTAMSLLGQSNAAMLCADSLAACSMYVEVLGAQL